jgi:hypothetical protein
MGCGVFLLIDGACAKCPRHGPTGLWEGCPSLCVVSGRRHHEPALAAELAQGKRDNAFIANVYREAAQRAAGMFSE